MSDDWWTQEVMMEQQALTEEVNLTSSKISGSDDADAVESALGGLDGVRSVRANPNTHMVTVKYDPTIVNLNLIAERLDDAGYPTDSNS
jgi:copper chaperone CopZ